MNVSGVQVLHYDIFTLIQDTTKKLEIDTKYLEIELTETSIMDNPDITIPLFEKIRKLGIRISIDDFGTGYSSLSYLKKFPIDKIKIDRSFIKDLPNILEDVAIVKAILTLGDNLNIDILAEGIDDMKQKKFLLENNCKEVQGFLFDKAIPKNLFERNYLLTKK